MGSIHHMTAKNAAKHGLTIVENGDSFEVRTVDGNHLVDAGLDPKAALAAAIFWIKQEDLGDDVNAFEDQLQAFIDNAIENADESDDDEEEGEGETPSKSIVKRAYKKAYKPFRNTCGDDFADLMAAAIKVSMKLDGKTVKRVDETKLRKLAKMNGVWDDRYANLNVGQIRMNVGNRMRALAKHGTELKWL